MTEPTYYVRHLTEQIEPPITGKQSMLLLDDADAKVMLFAFASGEGLSEHVAPSKATIQIIRGEATLTVGEETVDGKPGTWIQMVAKTPHSVLAKTPLLMLLTLRK